MRNGFLWDKCAILSTLNMMKSESNKVVLGGCPRKPQLSSRSLSLDTCKVIIASPCYRAFWQIATRRPMMSEARGKTYRPWDPEHYRREAHSPEAKLPEDDLVFFLLDTVSHLDLSRFSAP